jgi:predicted GH43/DUF377 family glycosyl hydrolase
MSWEKRGLIYKPDGSSTWAVHTVITPTPYLINENTIRIYTGFRDNSGVTRIGYIDVDAANPSLVKKVTANPILDIGIPGAFDDNGLILGDIVPHEGKLYMYYVGFQIPARAKFLAFSGLAISSDGGETFTRHSHAPVMDRTDKAPYIRAIHSVIKEDGLFRIWYSIGDGWETIGGTPYPRYRICHATSPDGITFPATDTVCLDVAPDEYRIGRPRVHKLPDGTYLMRSTADTYDKYYHTVLATSPDGLNWTRHPHADIAPSEDATAFDSQTAVYPVEITAAGNRYLFYSGNGMGLTGVGYAIWKEESQAAA